MEKINIYGIPINKEPLALLCRWIKERYTVHLKKDVYKEPYPWTDWDIMRDNRFTNVLRRHDKETKYILESTYENPNFTVEEKILNAFIFRAYNKHETYRMLGFPRHRKLITWDEVLAMEEVIKRRKTDCPSYIFFTAAFNTGGIKRTWGIYENNEAEFQTTNLIESRFALLWNDLIYQDIDKKILSCSSAAEAGAIMQTVRGFAGEFLPFQVYVDCTYIPGFPFTEEDWAISGPGCKLGIEYLFGDDSLSLKPLNKTHDELLYWTRDHIAEILKDNGIDLKVLMEDLPMEQRKLSLSNVENAFCEFSKTCKLVFKKNKSKRKYKPFLESAELY